VDVATPADAAGGDVPANPLGTEELTPQLEGATGNAHRG